MATTIGILASLVAALCLIVVSQVRAQARDATTRADAAVIAAGQCVRDSERDMQEKMAAVGAAAKRHAAQTLAAANAECARVLEAHSKTRAMVYDIGRRQDKTEQHCEAQVAACGRDFAHGAADFQELKDGLKENTRAIQKQGESMAALAESVRLLLNGGKAVTG